MVFSVMTRFVVRIEKSPKTPMNAQPSRISYVWLASAFMMWINSINTATPITTAMVFKMSLICLFSLIEMSLLLSSSTMKKQKKGDITYA